MQDTRRHVIEYRTPIGEMDSIEFNIPYYYEPTNILGSGSYGTVLAARCTSTNTDVAIKKISLNGNPIFCQRTIREIKLLLHLHHPNIINVYEVCLPDDPNNISDVYLVEELVQNDLSHIIRNPKPIPENMMQFLTYQLLLGVHAMHSANVLHRDLKPANVLVNNDCSLKICDFGLARPIFEQEGRDESLTQYVATRWYRAPELLHSSTAYSTAIDMWSVGCILAEMMGGKPLCPGKDYVDQMKKCLKVSGGLTEENMMSIQNSSSKNFIQTICPKSTVDLAQLYPHMPPLAIDLLKRMLTFNPKKRISAHDAICHPWLASVFDYRDVISLPQVSPEFFQFDKDLETLDSSIHFAVLCRELSSA